MRRLGFVCIRRGDPRTTADEWIRGPRGVTAAVPITIWMTYRVLAIQRSASQTGLSDAIAVAGGITVLLGLTFFSLTARLSARRAPRQDLEAE